MHGHHARPANSLFGLISATGSSSDGRAGVKHSGPGRFRFTGRLRRRILAYRAIDFLSTHIPGASGPGEECLLLVHIRQVVGQIHYQYCDRCAEGIITAVTIDERFRSAGLGTRALSHLRSCHPRITWASTPNSRITRDLLRRMRIPTVPGQTPCACVQQPLAGAPQTTSS
ncbi:hypothetical protein ACFYNY_20980 [Streptomyces sp. NPDC006530]|uniref:hypothetical protein n=1 Tax=Streptomyces sp. NPDC006530 TaxID=3364750 RepID=UPI0036A7DC20